MRECERVFFTRDGTNIEYDEAGSGDKLLLIHDSQGADDEITDLCGLLAQRHRVYCPARRGWSFSGGKGRGYSMEVECSDLIQFMEAFRIEKVYGMMYGGVVAMHIALRFPLKKMVVQSPFLASQRDLRWLPEMRRMVEREDFFGAMAVWLKGEFREYRLIPQGLLRAFLWLVLPRARTNADLAKEMITENFKPERLIRTEAMITQLVAELTAAVEAEPELSRLFSLETETLLLWDLSDAAYISASVDQLLTMIPGSRRRSLTLARLIRAAAQLWKTETILE